MTELSQELTEDVRRNISQTFESWAPHHTDGQLLTLRPFSPDDPYQRAENTRIEPEPSLEIARAFGNMAIGSEAYQKLCDGIREYDVLKTAIKRHKRAQNTLIGTLHLLDVYDTATTHNAIYVSSDADPEILEINDLVASPMLAYTDIGGMAVFRVLTASGSIDLALPMRGAKKHGMSRKARMYLARRTSEALDARLDTGIIINWALTGKRGVPIITKAGREAISVTPVEGAVAEYAIGKNLLAVPVPIDLEAGNSRLEVLEPRPLEKVSDIHDMTEEMVETAVRLSGKEIYYGLPEGAQLVEV